MGTEVIITGLVSLVLGLVGGAGVLIVFQRVTGENKIKASEEEAGKILNRAKGQAAKIDREAKGKAKDFESRARRNVEGDIKKQKQKLESAEQKLKEKEGRLEGDFKKKEDTLQQKLNSLEQRSDRIKIAEVRIQELEQKAEQEIQGLKNKLESVANMTADQARDELRKAMEEEVRQNLAGELQSIEDEMRAKADRNAKEFCRLRCRGLLAKWPLNERWPLFH